MKTGRPTKRTPEVEAVILDGLRKGYPKNAAAAAAGIGYSTLNQWENNFAEFRDALKRAEEQGKARLLDKVREADSWQAAAWMLERRWPNDFARREHVTVDMTAVVREIADSLGVDEAEAVAEAERILAGAR